ncbi:hypothetical protein BsWGS_04594 [Bradybaena similaris]
MYSPRIQHAQGLLSQGTFNPANRFHNQRPQFTPGPSQLQNSVSPQGNFQQRIHLSQGYSQQNQQISTLHNQFQAPAPSEHCRMRAGTSVPSFLPVNTQQQYSSPNSTSHKIHAGRSTQNCLPGHPQQQYGSPDTNSHTINAGRSAQTFVPGNPQQQQYGSSDTNSHTINAGRSAQTFVPGHPRQQYSSPSAISNSHAVRSERINIQTQVPQQTFSPGNQQQQYNSSNITSGTYSVPSDHCSGMHAQRPPQVFKPLNPQQQYKSSNTSSDAKNVPSDHRSIYAQRPQQTLPTNSQLQHISPGTSTSAHLATSSQRDNLLTGSIHSTQRDISIFGYTGPFPLSFHLHSNGDMLPDCTQTTSINYNELGIVPTSATVNLASVSLQQDRRNQSIDISNNPGITQQTGLAASYEMPCSTQAHHSSVNPAVGYLSSSEQRNQSQAQPYLSNSHCLRALLSSDQTVGASLHTQSLHNKSNTLASANMQQKSGKQDVCSVNNAVTCDKTSANCSDLNSHSLASLLNESNINLSETTELREANNYTTAKKQVSTNNSVNKWLWYKYPEEPAPLSFQSDLEVMHADISIADEPEKASITNKMPTPNACIDIQAKCNQSSSVDVAHTDIILPGTGNSHTSGCHTIENIKLEPAVLIKQELPDHLSAPEDNLSVERASISDSSPSGFCDVVVTNGGNNCSSGTECTDANSTSDTKNTVTSEPSSHGICTRTLLSNVMNSVTLQNTLTAVLQAPVDRSHPHQLPEVDTNIQLTKCTQSNSSSVSQATDTASDLFNVPANSDVIPHMHAANSHSIPSVIVDSDCAKDTVLSNINTQYSVSETGNSEPISANFVTTDQILLEKDTELLAKQQHIIVQAQNTLNESRLNQKSDSSLAALPGRLQNRRHKSLCLANDSDETCKLTPLRISAVRQSLDSSTPGQSKPQSKIQSGCGKKQIIGSKVTDSKSARKQKSDQKQSCSHDKSLSAREKVFNMWKSGQVVKNKADNAIQRNKSAEVTRINKSRLTIKSTDLKAVPANGSVVGKSSLDIHMNKAQEKIATDASVVAKGKKSKKFKKQKPACAICYVLIHGYKLICLKSETEDLILLYQFQFTCFPGRTLESLNMYIDEILKIKKRVLVHPEKEKIVTFLKENGYHTDSLIYTISVTDGRRVYHHLYGIEKCTNTLCGVKIPEAVRFDDLAKETRPLQLNGKHILDETSTDELTITNDSVKGPVVSATDTVQNSVDSPTMQYSDDSLNSRLCIDMSRALSDSDESDETLAYGESNVDIGNLAEVESAEESFEIHWVPGTQKVGGFIETRLGKIRWYRHNGDNFLAVDDLCRFCDTFYEYLSKEKNLFSCCQEIQSCLNELNPNYPPLKSRHQSLVKYADMDFSKIYNIYYNSEQDRSSISKRPLYAQGACNENSTPYKHPRLEADTLFMGSHNLMVVTQEANSQSALHLGKVHNPSEETENDESGNPARESSQVPAINKSISSRSDPCLDKENPFTSSGGHLSVENCVRNSMELAEHSENDLTRMTYTPIDITATMDTDSCCRNTDTIFDHSAIRQHDLMSPDSCRSAFSPDEPSFSIFDDGSNPDALPTTCDKQTLNQCRQNSHQPESFLFVDHEDWETVNDTTPVSCLTQQTDISVKHPGEPEMETAGSKMHHLETAGRPTMTNTPFESDTSVDCSDKSVAAKPKPPESLDDCVFVVAKQSHFMMIENCSMKAELCSDPLTKGASGRDSTTVPNADNAPSLSSTQQQHTTEGSNQRYEVVIVLPSSQTGCVSDNNTDNTPVIVKSTSRPLGEEDSGSTQKYRDKTGAPAYGKLLLEHDVAHQPTKHHSAGMPSPEDIEPTCLVPSSLQCLEFQRCVDDMDIITSSNTSMLATSSYRKAYAKLLQQYRALLGDNTRLRQNVAELKKDCKGCKHYEEVINLMITDYKWG